MVGGNITQYAAAGYCDCCQCKHFGEVRKLAELMTGLTIYHAPREVEETDETKSIKKRISKSLPKLGDSAAAARVVNTNSEHAKKMQADDKMVFILHNTKDDDIPSEKLLSEFDIKTINCPRCQYIMKRAKTLLEGLPVVGRKMIRCVCDLCTLQRQSRVPCNFCQSIIKQFTATGIRDERIKEHFMSFLANAARSLTKDLNIQKYKNVQADSDSSTEGISKIGDLIERQKSSLREKNISISDKLTKVKKVIITTPETVLPTENLFVDGNRDSDDKLSTVKLHPIIKRSSDTGSQKQLIQRIERVKQSLYHTKHIPCKSFSNTVLGIGITGLKQPSSSELSLSLAIKKDTLKEPMKFFFPRRLQEKKMKLEETSFDLIKDTKERLKADADEKFIKQAGIKKSTKSEQMIVAKSEKMKKTEEKMRREEARNIEKREGGSKGSKPSSGEKRGDKTKKREENVGKMGEKKIKADNKKKQIESRKTKEGGIKMKLEKDTKKSKGKTTADILYLTRQADYIKLGRKRDELSEDKKKHKKKDEAMKKSQDKKEKVSVEKDKETLKDEEIQTVNDEKVEKKDEKDGKKVQDKTQKRLKFDKTAAISRSQKLPSVGKKEIRKYGKIPAVGAIKEEVILLNKVIKKHEKAKSDSFKYKQRHEKKIKEHKEKADKKAKQLQLSKSGSYIDIKSKRQIYKEKFVQMENTPGKPEPENTEIEVKFKDIRPAVTHDGLILKLIQKYRQRMKLKELEMIKAPIKGEKIKSRRQATATTSSYSLADEDSIESDELKDKTRSELDLVYGNKIIAKRDRPPPPEPQLQPTLFQSFSKKDEDIAPTRTIEQATTTEGSPSLKKDTPHTKRSSTQQTSRDSENLLGVFKYALSDHTYIENGWTVLPVEKIIRKMNVYRMRPAQSEFDWFERHIGEPLFYDSGEKLTEVTDNGRGQWYYKNGRLALDYYDTEDLNAQQRFVIYSSGDIDDRGRYYPVTVLGMFDYKGNGVVFDHSGKIRLKYNQTEGVVLDRGVGPVCHWSWHSLNEPPELQQVMIDTRLPFTDPTIYAFKDSDDDHITLRTDDETMAAIEFDNYVKSKTSKVTKASKFEPYQIKMKALRINDQFSLKVLDQKTVYLIFREGGNTMRLNLGMVLDHTEVVDTTSADLGEVTLDLEEQQARTTSVADLQKSLLNAQRAHRVRTERELKKRPLAPGLSVNKLTSAVSKPTRTPLLTTNVLTNYSKCGIPIANNLYTNTRLI